MQTDRRNERGERERISWGGCGVCVGGGGKGMGGGGGGLRSKGESNKVLYLEISNVKN